MIVQALQRADGDEWLRMRTALWPEDRAADGCESSPVAFLEGWYVDADTRGKGVGRQPAEDPLSFRQNPSFRKH